MLRPNNFPFQLKQDVNECHFGLPQFWAVIQLTLTMRILYTRDLLLTMRIGKVKWITAHNCSRPKSHSFTSSLCWKVKKFWYHFYQEKLLHTLIPVIASTYCGKYAVRFFSGPLCIMTSFFFFGGGGLIWLQIRSLFFRKKKVVATLYIFWHLQDRFFHRVSIIHRNSALIQLFVFS